MQIKYSEKAWNDDSCEICLGNSSWDIREKSVNYLWKDAAGKIIREGEVPVEALFQMLDFANRMRFSQNLTKTEGDSRHWLSQIDKNSDYYHKIPNTITVEDDGTLWIPTVILKSYPFQSAGSDEAIISELAESMRESGIMNTIVIEMSGNETFVILAGERRAKAACLAGLEKIPVRLAVPRSE